MRIAIPPQGGDLHPHCGHCIGFALIDRTPATGSAGAREDIQTLKDRLGLLPPWLNERGVTIVIAGGIGDPARSLLSERSVAATVGTKEEGQAVLVEYHRETSTHRKKQSEEQWVISG